MGFICSAGAATIKLQREMSRGNISAGASLSSRGNTRRRFLLHPGRAGPRCCGAPAAPQPCASGDGKSSVFHAQGWFWCCRQIWDRGTVSTHVSQTGGAGGWSCQLNICVGSSCLGWLDGGGFFALWKSPGGNGFKATLAVPAEGQLCSLVAGDTGGWPCMSWPQQRRGRPHTISGAV